MLYLVLTFLVNLAVTLFGSACLLRCYMRWLGMPRASVLLNVVCQLTDWLVLPLRKLIPLSVRWDWASCVAAWLMEMIQSAVLSGSINAWRLPIAAAIGTLRLGVSVALGAVLATVLMLWISARSPIQYELDYLCRPLLAPVRRYLPRLGALDLSPLIVLLILQVAGMVLDYLRYQLLAGFMLRAWGA